MFERFTEKSRRVLVIAQEHAVARGAAEIRNEHILLALADDGVGGAAGEVLERCGIDGTVLAAAFAIEEGHSPATGLPFSRQAKKMLELSLREALQLGHNYIGTEHLLLGILRVGGTAADWLVERGVTRASVIALLPDVIGRPMPRSRRFPRRTGRVTEYPTPHEVAKAAAEGRREDVDPERLLAWASEEGSAAQRVFAALGIDADRLQEAVAKVVGEGAQEGPVVLDLGGGVSVRVEDGDQARDLRALLRPLVDKGVVSGEDDDGTFVAAVPGMLESVTTTVTAWLEAAGETAA